MHLVFFHIAALNVLPLLVMGREFCQIAATVIQYRYVHVYIAQLQGQCWA